MRRTLPWALALWSSPLVALAQPITLTSPGTAVAVDESAAPAGLEVTLATTGAVPDVVRLSGRGLERIRVLDGGAPLVLPAELPGRRLPVTLVVAGRLRSQEPGDVGLVAEAGASPPAELALTVVELRFLGPDGAPLDPARGTLHVSNAVTDDEGLPRDAAFTDVSSDPDVLRLEVVDPTAGAASLELESIEPTRGLARDRIAALPVLRAGGGGVAARSAFVRLVADQMDRSVPGLQGQLLRVALGDRVRARWRGAIVELPVGRAAPAGEPEPTLFGRFDIVVLRLEPGGRPVAGMDDAEANAIARRQVEIANEVYAQCGVSWGEPGHTRVRVVDPPRATLLAVSDGEGLTALGGEIRLRVGGRAIRPFTTRPGWSPRETATAIGEHIRALGLTAVVTENARTDPGAAPSADVVARGPHGEALAFEPDGDVPMTTDRRQTLAVGSVDLTDLLDDFDNMTASSGTLEERTLWKTLADGDPETIDMFLVNRFASGGRQGEAFIEGDGSSVVNAVFLDRSGLRQERESWTQSHEAGHVVLDQAFHPDNTGPDRPWLLMDADASLGAVSGPKRLGDDECLRMRAESGPDASPSLLHREEWP